MATQEQDIPIYVVRDGQGQRPQYGNEVPNKGWQSNLNALVDAIGSYQKANPVKIPAPAGAKTVRQKQLDEDTRRYEQEWPLQEALTKSQIANTRRSANAPYGGSGSGGGSGITKNDALNQLFQRIYGLKDQGHTREEVEGAIYSSASDLGSNINTKDIQGLLDQIYGTSEEGDVLQGIINGTGGGEVKTMSPVEAMKQALKERPWWQKTIDILPGKQYR